MGQQYQNKREQAEHFLSLANYEPDTALSHLSELPQLLISDDVEVRRVASKALTKLAHNRPFALRSTTEALLARIDDTDVVVRTNILGTLALLAQWYPQDLRDGTNLMVESLNAGNESERLAAAMVVSQIGYQRPDLVTPSEKARSHLEKIRVRTDVDGDEKFGFDGDILRGAIKALEGGDMASRPLEDDLVSSGNRALLSTPAWVAITAFLWVPLTIASVIFFVSHWVIFVRRTQTYPPGVRIKLAVSKFRNVTFLSSWKRGRLYLRRSWVATPAWLIPIFRSTRPIKADPSAELPPYPENWGEIATVVNQRDEFECRNCGNLGGPRGDTELHVDHQTPRSKGGKDMPENLRTLCRQCHEARHARKFDD